MVRAMFNNPMLSATMDGAAFLLTHHPLLRNQLWMDPIPESLMLNSRTDGEIPKDLAKAGKAEGITVPINTENVVESLNKIGADGMTVTTATIVTVQIVTSVRKLGRLMVSPSL